MGVLPPILLFREKIFKPLKKLWKNWETADFSGKPLEKRITEVIRYLAEKSNNSFPIIGVGGIHSAEDAIEKLGSRASLVQIYRIYLRRSRID